MPRLAVLVYPDLSIEPVTVGQLKAQVREDSTAPEVVDLLGVKLQAARDVCERHCGRLWASATVEQTFDTGEPYELLPGAGTVSAVRGFYTDVAELARLNDTGYQAEYLKGVTISRDFDADYTFNGYGLRRDPATFTVTYPVVVAPAQVPPAVKEAILKLAAELYDNRETSTPGREALLSVNYRTLLAPYVLRNPIYQP